MCGNPENVNIILERNSIIENIYLKKVLHIKIVKTKCNLHLSAYNVFI